MSRAIAAHYRSLLKEHGDTAAAAQYSSRASQERRFAVLSMVGDLRGASVLDYGCGSAHLATFLKARGQAPARYTGVDIVDELLEMARAKHPEGHFGRPDDVLDHKFDYVLVSGVFNNRRRDNRRFYSETLKGLFGLCTRGLAFNMMSTYVDYRDPALFYEAPERVLGFVKRELTPYVVLRHDYEVKPGVVPFEFAVFAYRQPLTLEPG